MIDVPLPPPKLPQPRRGDMVTLYTMGEAAVYLRLGESTVRRFVRTHIIPAQLATRIGGRVFMTGDQIARFIEMGAQPESAVAAAQGRHARRKPRKVA